MKRRVVFCLGVLSTAVSLDSGPIAAQSAGPRPHVGITALPGPRTMVWPADFNGDRKIDLLTARDIVFEGDRPRGGELVLRRGRGDATFGAERVIATPTLAAPLAAADVDDDGHLDIIAIDRFVRAEEEAPLSIWVLPGKGDGTFRGAVEIDAHLTPRWAADAGFALVADFDDDGHADVAVGAYPDALHIYPGHGDFTFSPRITMTTGAWPNGGVVSDLNGDGKPDLAVATRPTFESGWIGGRVDVFLNKGGFLFAAATIPVEHAALDVAAADLNGDRRRDLIVSTAPNVPDPEFIDAFGEGHLLVMMGKGDGTFRPPAEYPTPRGPVRVIAGDFNRDGLLDVATGNNSQNFEEECGPLWSSVSILRGDGTGALAAAASVQFSYDPAVTGWVRSLRMAHVNGDTHPDLVASGGILVNRPAAANRRPIANAGVDRTITNADEIPSPIAGVASDRDHDLLTYRWTDADGVTVATCLHPGELPEPPGELRPGDNRFTLVVSDDRGDTAADSILVRDLRTNHPPALIVHQPTLNSVVSPGAPFVIRWSASDPDGLPIVDVDIAVGRIGQPEFEPIPECTDLPGTVSECVWKHPNVADPDAELLFVVRDANGDAINLVSRFRLVEMPDGPLPVGWSNRDIGTVAVAGSAAFHDGTFVVRGAGADIWSAADELHFAFLPVSGDFEVTARVATVERVNGWTKAGLMIRESLAAGSRHASIFSTPSAEKPVAFQRRPARNGPSAHTPGPVRVPPVWLMLRRTGNVVAAFYRSGSNEAWIAVGTQTLRQLSPTVQVGLALSSHVDGTLATATFDNVSITPKTPDGLPPGWACGDIGRVARRGRCASPAIAANQGSDRFEVRGSGADVWGTADEFSFAAIRVSGDFSITARVRSLQGLHRWTKAGIMIRDWGLQTSALAAAGRRHASLFVTPSMVKGTAFQRRRSEHAASVHTPGPVTIAPVWLKLVRTGNRISAYHRKTSTGSWKLVGTETFSALPGQLSAMLVVSSHVDGSLATASFDAVLVEQLRPGAKERR